MPTYHEAQLPDGRCVRLRELTSQEHARAYDAAAVHRPDGGLAPPNPLTLARELHMAALVAVTDVKPLFKCGPDGKPLPRLGADGLPMRRVDAAGNPVLRNGQPVVALQRFDLGTLTPEDWRPLTYGELNTRYDDLFGPKARVVIEQLFNRAHSVDLSEEGQDFFETMRAVSSTG